MLRIAAAGCAAGWGLLHLHWSRVPAPFLLEDLREKRGRRVCVVGAGVVGLTTAYQLARRGFQVEVVDAEPRAAAGCSAQAGGVFARARRLPTWEAVLPQGWESAQVLRTKRFDVLGLLRDPWWWCFAPIFGPTTLALLLDWPAAGLAASRAAYGELLLRAEGEWDAAISEIPELRPHDRRGWLRFYRDERSFAEAAAAADAARGQCVLSDSEAYEAEPLLRSQQICGAVLCPNERWAHPGAACRALEAACAALPSPVTFRYSAAVTGFDCADGRVTAAVLSDGRRLWADHFVLCGGAATGKLAARIGVSLPVFPLRGYTATVSSEGAAPEVQSGPYLWDVDLHAGLGRFGDAVRVSCGADFSPHDNTRHGHPAMSTSLRQYARSLTPQISPVAPMLVETGGRPLTPDWAPVVGPLRANVWVNAGHGTAGWTLAWACAPLIADAMTGKEPAVDLAPLSPLRFDFAARLGYGRSILPLPPTIASQT
eukprot:TRINITY_DN45205_c0_g1_i1.p1 TRINITY_DN45205_c0_g1~~TRINITY_DN45205_c0_g1_i1.p1  ORF type:complete len:514 (+),score=140.93 TRINITY_DN45205_c0_g1_i1:88-1542(+)